MLTFPQLSAAQPFLAMGKASAFDIISVGHNFLHLSPQMALGPLAWNVKGVHTQQSAPHPLPVAFYGKQSSSSPSPKTKRCGAMSAAARVIPIKGILISPMPVKVIGAAQFCLSSPSYTFSADANRFTVVGCYNYPFFREFYTDNMIGGCIALCSKEQDLSASCTGFGCCQTSFPKGLKSFSLFVSAFYNLTNVSDFDECGYAFLGEKDTWNFRGAADLNAKASDFEEKIKKNVPVVIEWTVGTENCNQSQLNSSGYACQQNTKCVDFDGGTVSWSNLGHGHQV
ncbi:hypothetical protein Ancab_000314 [Ancistrocladus abbreviatus]